DKRQPLEDRTLWSMLYSTAARAEEMLRLDVTDLDRANRRARTIRKGGKPDDLLYDIRTARMLGQLLAATAAARCSCPPAPGTRTAAPSSATSSLPRKAPTGALTRSTPTATPGPPAPRSSPPAWRPADHRARVSLPVSAYPPEISSMLRRPRESGAAVRP